MPHTCSLLAELMLPDGAHLRAEDWTVFYLPTDSLNSSLEATQEVLQSPVNEIYPQGGQNRLLYVLNLVRTKKDNRVRR